MKRRSFIAGILAVLGTPGVAQTQQAPAIYRIGYIAAGPTRCPPTVPSRAFRQGLSDAGYTEGRDVVVDRRCFPTGDMAGRVLRDVLEAAPNVLVAANTAAAGAARDAALGIPVVFVNVADPVGSRLVQSLARPGSNMTGLADLTRDLNAKRVQLLKEALPDVRRVSTLSTPDDPGTEQARADIDQAAATLGLQVRHFMVRSAADLPGALEAMKKDGLQAFVVMQAPLFWTERGGIASLATRHRLPGMYPIRAHVEEGGLISYGADQADLYRRAAGYVVKILKGAKPGDLPVEQPTKFELTINLKTAKMLGVTIPRAVLLQADYLIQ